MTRLRVLVTGASGVFGRSIVERLVGRGHDVVALARRPVRLPDGVVFRAADIRDADAVAAAMDGCEVVAHCAWAVGAMYDDPAEREINVGGTQNVLAAMERVGARRIVFAGSSTAYGPRPDVRTPIDEQAALRPHPEHVYGQNKLEVERLLAEAPVEDVRIRATICLGRRIDNRLRNILAGPALVGSPGQEQLWQLVHADDVGRFFAIACEGGPPGPVNLAADDVLDVEELAAVLGRRVLRVPARAIEPALRTLWNRHLSPVQVADFAFLNHMPILDTTRLREEFGFSCAWSTRETVEDTRLAVVGFTAVGDRAVRLAWRHRFEPDVLPADTPPLDGAPLERCGPVELEGEFDTPIDVRFSTFTSTNLSEALPGPATPLSLTTVAPGIAAALSAAADFVGMTGVAGLEARSRFLGIFGHRLWVNVTCAAAIGELSPGWSAESVTEQYLGRHADEVDVSDPETLPLDRPAGVRGKTAALARTGVRAGGAIVGYRRDVDEIVQQVERLDRLVAEPAALTDEQLEARFRLGRDIVAQGWRLAGVGAALAGAATSTAEKVAGRTGVVDLVGGADLPSGAGLSEIRRLAEIARARPEVAAVLAQGGAGLAARATALSPELAREAERSLERFGHRGPAECELAASSFGDDLDLLFGTVANALEAPPLRSQTGDLATLPRRARRLARYARRITIERERNRDRVVRATWLVRQVAREQGRRLAERGTLEDADDVFYLTADELFASPADAAERASRRRRERERLAELRFPVAFTAPWAPLTSEIPVLGEGEVLNGVGASPGVARGIVRIVRPETIDLLCRGEILVAHVTDVGYTPMFGYAAAVVTDIGGLMSHAAVVAREFGVPAVVDTADATRSLRDGALVEVDGSAGTVRVVEA